MKHTYLKLVVVLSLFTFIYPRVFGQCPTVPAPVVSGNTIAPCVLSSSFTLSTSNPSSLTPAWYSNPWGGAALSTNSLFVTPTFTSGTTYYVGVSTSVSNESITLPGFSSPYSGNTRGMWFTAPVSFIITGVRVPLDVGSTANSAIAILQFPSAPPVYATTTNSFNVLYLNQNISGTGIVPVHIPVNCGDVIGLLGSRGNITSYGPTNPVPSTIGTNTLLLTRLGMQYSLTTQVPIDVWQEPTGSLGRMEVYTTLGSLSTLTPVTVTVVPSPQINISGPSGNICANSTTTLTASGVTTYTWGSGSNSTTLAVTPSVNTTYSVSGTVFTSCTSTAAITISVDPGAPVLNVVSSNSVICSGGTVNLIASGATTYSWSGGINNNMPFIPLVTTSYSVQGANSCGTTTAVELVSVNITPTITSTASASLICNGEATTLTAVGATNYTWMPVNATGSTIVVSPTTATAYQIVGQSSAGCEANGIQVIVVNPKPVVTANISQPVICSGGSATLNTGGNANTYSWPGVSPSGSAVVSPTSNSTFTAIGTFTSTGCTSAVVVSVSVFAPTPAISSATSVCLGSAVTITVGGANTFTWNGGSQFSSITVTPAVNTTYSVSATTNSFNISCVGQNTVFVSVNPTPTILASSTRTAICNKEKTILTANGGNTYTWSTAAMSNTIQVSPSLQTVYTVEGSDGNGCVSTGQITIQVSACTALELYERSGSRIGIFPNPSTGYFNISTSETIELQIINEQGEIVLKRPATLGSDVRVEGLAPGVYFIVGNNEGNLFCEKVVVLK